MIAYHFPPMAGSSGIQRTLRFARYLGEFGWEPIVLTAHPRAYEHTSSDQLSDVPPGTIVKRAQAFDTARHFAINQRYPGFLARPDRWVSWYPGAVLSGLSIIRQHKPNAIWSTYPIATAHLIGGSLQEYSRLPWIADFRDPMAQDGYPADPRVWKSFKRIEERTVKTATLCTFTTPGTVNLYAERYSPAKDRLKLIENGYDEETFEDFETQGKPLCSGKFTLLHSGIVYPNERDPTHFLQALRNLIDRGGDDIRRLRVRFRASAHDEFLRSLISKLNLAEFVELCPPIPYREALDEMMRADALLILQASNCNDQIPAKLYEYMRAGRPIIALTDPVGDTARVLRVAGLDAIAPLDKADAIYELLARIMAAPNVGTLATENKVKACSRRARTEELANLLNQVASRISMRSIT